MADKIRAALTAQVQAAVLHAAPPEGMPEQVTGVEWAVVAPSVLQAKVTTRLGVQYFTLTLRKHY
jgi:hypothetical protein